MSPMRHLDFDLQITRAADGYRAQVGAPGSEATTILIAIDINAR